MMKSKKECPECKTKYEPTRRDQKFCSATCRWNAWRKKEKNNKEAQENKSLAGIKEPEQKQEPEKTNLFDSLRNVPVSENKQTETNPKQTQTINEVKSTLTPAPEVKKSEPALPVETKEYKEARENKEKIEAYYQRALSLIETCDKRILEIEHELSGLPKVPDKSRYRNWGMDAEDLFGGSLFEAQMTREWQRENLQRELQKKKDAKQKICVEAIKAEAALLEAEERLKTIKQFEEPKQEKKLSLSQMLSAIKSKKEAEEKKKSKIVPAVIAAPAQTNLSEQETANVSEEENTFVTQANSSNPKIRSSSEIRDLKYDIFPFTGKWGDFFGTPQFSFHVGVFGRPGEGKSTFCVQFADYLAKNFGKVIYISGEEGLAKTVQDKLVNNGINNPYLFFGDIRSYEEITSEIPNEYHFIFIDSLDTLKIDKFKVKALKEHYPQSSFVTISQSTKDGKMRGSQEIMHDNDVMVKVEKGIAVTIKNRFYRTGQEFRVFDTLETIQKKKESKLIIPKRLKIDEKKQGLW